MQLPITSRQVTRVEFDFGVAFLIDGGWHLRLETPFTLRVGELSAIVDPSAAIERAASIIGLLHRTIDAADVALDGTLHLAVEGSLIVAKPNKDFEAWTFSGPRGVKVVCLPGGGLSTWRPEDE